MDDIQPIDLNLLATKVRHGIYSSYRAVTNGAMRNETLSQFQQMSNPRIGDLVTEETTIYYSSRETDIDAVGILEEIAQEPVVYDDENFVWDEEYEGRPHPTETVFYIRTLDGRRHRWVNARFIAAGHAI